MAKLYDYVGAEINSERKQARAHVVACTEPKCACQRGDDPYWRRIRRSVESMTLVAV